MTNPRPNLWRAIKQLNRAIRLKAHPKLIERLERIKHKEAKKVACLLNGSSIKEIVEGWAK